LCQACYIKQYLKQYHRPEILCTECGKIKPVNSIKKMLCRYCYYHLYYKFRKK
jgi:transcription initiation factor TFIIIB Brf1 subunit/transcription initiation factor TFIIB